MEKTMDKIVALAKSRCFVYPGAEIYGGLANTWDYGNLGVCLLYTSNVRVKGGAYGCMSGFGRNGNSYFASYRDPNLRQTNEIYERCV